MILWSNLEYVTLRIVRKFLFKADALDRIGAFLPYWRVNQGRLDPEPIVTAYQKLARLAGVDILDKRVAELGCGAANGTGYEWTSRFGGTWIGVEPYALFDPELDERLLEQARWRNPRATRDNARRVRELAALDDGSVDVIVSNSVLEHVRDPDGLFRECWRVLAPGGTMLHRVDYRDHFFKYPFHFLTFSKGFWDTMLDPGDLPRFRLDDHLDALARCGFHAEVAGRETDRASLDAVAPFLDGQFARRDRDMLSTTIASIVCRKSP
ncbi:MAG: class I SAM-dependent methyltransferase [Thermodesulfobacteriota bacterium]